MLEVSFSLDIPPKSGVMAFITDEESRGEAARSEDMVMSDEPAKVDPSRENKDELDEKRDKLEEGKCRKINTVKPV